MVRGPREVRGKGKRSGNIKIVIDSRQNGLLAED
jgi:hypothetical protein